MESKLNQEQVIKASQTTYFFYFSSKGTTDMFFWCLILSWYRNFNAACCYTWKFRAEPGWRLLRREALTDVTICDVIFLSTLWFQNSYCGLENIPCKRSVQNFKTIWWFFTDLYNFVHYFLNNPCMCLCECLSVCVSVCLWVDYLKDLWIDFD